MEMLTTPRILISGTHDACGKTMLGIGLTYELRRRNVSVSCCVVGPNLCQSILYKRLSGRYVRCLDEQLLTNSQILQSLYMAGVGADVLLICGRAGLYDGTAPGSLRGSDAELATLSKTPVVLMLDGRGAGASIGATIKGFTSVAKGFDVAGAVLNRISLAPNEFGDVLDKDYYNTCLQTFQLPPLLGAIPELTKRGDLPTRNPTQRVNQTSLPMQFFLELGTAIGRNVAIDDLLAKAQNVVSLRVQDFDNRPSNRRTRIAVSDDSCFHLCFQDNLDLLRYYGAEVVTFSPLADSSLPDDIGGVYITGAYLAEYGHELSSNKSMMESIRGFADRGGVIYSEGAGSAYLARDFVAGEKKEVISGVGVFNASAVAEKNEFSYLHGVTVEDTILGRPGLLVKGIDTGEWKFTREERMVKGLRLAKKGAAPYHEGYSPGAQALGTLCFFHMGSNPELAKNFVDSAEVAKKL